MLILTHLQKDDSLIPLLPYASGCLLASVLLTISGIAETHPKALALATQLIQLGWLLLQVQGAMLVWKFGTRGQATALFKVWLVSVQLLDVHRRYLILFFATTTLNLNSAVMGHYSPTWISLPISTSIGLEESTGSLGRKSCNRGNHGLVTTSMVTMGPEDGNLTSSVLGSVRAYYMSMICSAIPELCNFQKLLQNPSWVSGSNDDQEMFENGRDQGQDTDVAQTAVVVGMKEMEYQVVFEILAGLCVSSLMVAVWLWMRALQKPTGIPLQSRTRSRQRTNLGICSFRTKARIWRVLLEDKVVRMADQFEMIMATTIGTSQKKSIESDNDENDPTTL